MEEQLLYVNLLQCEKGFCTPWRRMDNPYLLYVHAGDGRFAVGEKVHETKPGHLYFCPRGVKNAIFADQNTPFLLSGVDFTGNTEGLLPEVCAGESGQFMWLLHELVRAFSLGSTKDGYVSHLFRAWLCLVKNLSNGGGPLSEAEKMKNYIFSRYNQPLSAQEVARAFHYNSHYAGSLFKQQFGTSMKQYQISLRMQKAREYLAYSGRTVSEIAAQVGFLDVNYFSRLFKKKTGVSPLAYRLRGRA